VTGAVRTYQIGIDSGDPDVSLQAAINLGCLLRDDFHDLPGARAAFELVAASRHPGYAPHAWNNLAYIAQLEGNCGEAERRYREAVASLHPDAGPWAMVNLARLLEDVGDVDEARRWYQSAVAIENDPVMFDAREGLLRVGGTTLESVKPRQTDLG
jgi:Tfp pilus assembly protein PilF